MSNVKLYEYQLSCIDTICKFWEKDNRQFIQLPTGAGKTYIFLHYIKNFGEKCLIICPTLELQDQIEESGRRFDLSIFAKRDRRFKNSEGFDHFVIVAASLRNEDTLNFLLSKKFDHIIIDEAHKAQSITYMNFLEKYKEKHPDFRLLGVTATPERLDEKPLTQIFGHLTFSMNLIDLIKDGWLSDLEGYRFKTQNKIRTFRRADFRPMDLRKLDNESRNQIIYEVYEKNCVDKKTIIFCLDIQHAEAIAAHLQSKGHRAQSIHGKMKLEKRRQILQAYKRGDIQVLTNCQLLTEGFDEPSIQALIIARPTKSKSLYCQMIGRGVRKFPGKEVCYLYELTDNAHNICSFNVATSVDNRLFEYKPGIRLTQLERELKNVSLIETEIVKVKYDLFEDYFDDLPATWNQLNYLKKKKIHHIGEPSFKECAFLIWMYKLKRIYGYN